MTNSKKAGGVAAVVALAALITGTALLTGKRGQKNRALLRGWAVKAKAEVLEEVEKVKDITEDAYTAIVDKVIKRYQKTRDLGAKDLALLRNELKDYWRKIARFAKQADKKTVSKSTKK